MRKIKSKNLNNIIKKELINITWFDQNEFESVLSSTKGNSTYTWELILEIFRLHVWLTLLRLR